MLGTDGFTRLKPCACAFPWRRGEAEGEDRASLGEILRRAEVRELHGTSHIADEAQAHIRMDAASAQFGFGLGVCDGIAPTGGDHREGQKVVRKRWRSGERL